MEHQFWHEKWESGNLGFHQDELNPLLLRHWPTLGVPAGAGVFVPLCGKSRDMIWLADQGYKVLGVELSEIAARAFFHEHALRVSRRKLGPFVCYESGPVRILCGDFFLLTPEMLDGVAAMFDRAAFIALPAGMRATYAAALRRLLPPGVRALLITLGYRDGLINPPPFRVGVAELRTLCRPWCDLELLARAGAEVKSQRATEYAYRLEVRQVMPDQ